MGPGDGPDIGTLYDELTDGFTRPRRVSELVYDAAERAPGLVPTRADIDAERRLSQQGKVGLEIAQGELVARILAEPRCGLHLVHSMTQPTTRALALLSDYQRSGAADLGPVRVDRDGPIGRVTIQNHSFLNSEDDISTAALETAVDLVLLDDEVEVGVLRGGPATHPKHAGRRIFGSGVNLTHLHDGQISLVEFMIERELGSINKMYRGHPLGPFDEQAERRGAARPAGEALDRRGGLLRHRWRVPVAPGDGSGHRRDRLVLQPARPPGGHHPRVRQPALASLRRRTPCPAGHLLQPRVPG